MKATDVLDATLTLFNVQAVNTSVFLRNLFHVHFVRLSGENSTLEVYFQGSKRFASRDSRIKKFKSKQKGDSRRYFGSCSMAKSLTLSENTQQKI